MAYTFDNLKKFLDEATTSNYCVPGADCKVLYKGKEVFRYTTGYADKEKGIPLTKDHYFYIYSASKVILAVAGMQMIEQGKFLPYDPVSMYLPFIADMKYKCIENGETVLKKVGNLMRIQDLFTMSAGFSYNIWTCKPIDDLLAKNPNANTEELIKAFCTVPLEFEPATSYMYSMCHDVLALVIEKVSGMKYSEYVQENIFKPLGMKAYYHLNDEVKSKLATLYYRDDNKGETLKNEQRNGFIITDNYDSGGAGVITNVDEYSKLAYALANGGVGQNGNQILHKRTINLMRTNVLDERRLAVYRGVHTSNHGYGYGFGVRVKTGEDRAGNLANIGEFGWDGAAGFFVAIEPENELAIIYAQHMLNPHNYEHHTRIRNLVHLALDI